MKDYITCQNCFAILSFESIKCAVCGSVIKPGAAQAEGLTDADAPEPPHTDGRWEHDGAGNIFVVVADRYGDPMQQLIASAGKEDAARIVLLANLCQGLTTGEIKNMTEKRGNV